MSTSLAPSPPAPLPTTSVSSGASPTPAGARLVSLDAYRGFIMMAMASSGFAVARFVAKQEQSGATVEPWVRVLGYQLDHVAWVGCAFWDLIQPSFMFMVGVALPFSVASRTARGDSFGKQLFHAVWRALLLILLAVFLSSPQELAKGVSTTGPTTQWVFTNVLAQIGMGYVFVFLLVGRGLLMQLGATLAILAGYTLYFAAYPAAGPNFDWASVGAGDVPVLTGWFAHWNKNSNAAHFFDVWFLNLFPRVEPFHFNKGGYLTLNFIPSMATMILGLIAGEKLRRPGSNVGKLIWLVAMGIVCLAVGLAMGEWVNPIVKRIWTPSWAVYSAGWTFLMLAGFFAVIDLIGWKNWAFPFVVVGMNSIAMYCMSQQLRGCVRRNLHTHVGDWLFARPVGPILETTLILVVLWLICLWLYRRKIFLRL